VAKEHRNGCHAISVAYPCAGKHGIPTTGKLRLPHGTHTFRNRNYLLEQSPLRARVLGWNAAVEARVGPPPAWAECLPPGSSTPQEFLATLGALVHAGGTAAENWPRAGLEAMAAGVPVVADRRGGWPEMIRHGETGYLCDDDRQFACYTARLACDEPHRLAIIRRARQAVESELANSAAIWAAWRQLFEGLDR
jgi:glycosyltransferase involved in cell wall biosynthesis